MKIRSGFDQFKHSNLELHFHLLKLSLIRSTTHDRALGAQLIDDLVKVSLERSHQEAKGVLGGLLVILRFCEFALSAKDLDEVRSAFVITGCAPAVSGGAPVGNFASWMRSLSPIEYNFLVEVCGDAAVGPFKECIEFVRIKQQTTDLLATVCSLIQTAGSWDELQEAIAQLKLMWEATK